MTESQLHVCTACKRLSSWPVDYPSPHYCPCSMWRRTMRLATAADVAEGIVWKEARRIGVAV